MVATEAAEEHVAGVRTADHSLNGDADGAGAAVARVARGLFELSDLKTSSWAADRRVVLLANGREDEAGGVVGCRAAQIGTGSVVAAATAIAVALARECSLRGQSHRRENREKTCDPSNA